MKRILTIQDISCVGKCSLTVALPVISACGIEAAILPTAVLSTHTAFKNFTFKDLTDEISSIEQVWKKEQISFDGIYTGYLGSDRQIDIVADLFENFKTEKNFILVDPAMADNGRLYKGFNEAFALHMAKLCGKADVICPNMTEAAFMLGIPYVEKGYSETYVKDLLKRLCALGCKKAVLTGINLDGERIGAYAFDAERSEYSFYAREHLPYSFHGTGDVFASALCGALTNGYELNDAIRVAVDFTVESIKKSVQNPNHSWYGVDFEAALPLLTNKFIKQ